MDNRSGNISNSSKTYTTNPEFDRCQVLISNVRKCGETGTLQIIQECKNMYETKMKQIDAEAGGDCMQAKINLQQEWIRDLIEQNGTLVRVIEELELEATNGVAMLEQKLQRTSKNAYERTVLLKQQNKRIKELEEELTNLVHGGETEKASQDKNLSQQYSDLKKSMMDMQEALTAEVISKHNTILSLRRDLQVLEEQCRKAEQQTDFKDDIIKKLRKEIKQLKQQQTNLSKNRTRSPHTLKDSNVPDCFQQCPDPSLSNLGDDLLVSKNTEIAGDLVISQRLKEKVRDPRNQTIIYISENSSYLRKTKNKANIIEDKKLPESNKAVCESGDSTVGEIYRNEFYKCYSAPHSLDNSSVNRNVDAYEANSYGIARNQNEVQQNRGNDFGRVDTFRNNDTTEHSLFCDSFKALCTELQSIENVDASKLELSDESTRSKPDSSTNISDLLNRRKINSDNTRDYESEICLGPEKTQVIETKTELHVFYKAHRECDAECDCNYNQEERSSDFSQENNCGEEAHIHVCKSESCSENLEDNLNKTNEIEAECTDEVTDCQHKTFGAQCDNNNATNISFHESEIKGASSPYRVDTSDDSNKRRSLLNDDICTSVSVHDASKTNKQRGTRSCSAMTLNLSSEKCPRLSHTGQKSSRYDDLSFRSRSFFRRSKKVSSTVDNFESQKPVKLRKEKPPNNKNNSENFQNDDMSAKLKELSDAEKLQKKNL